MVVRDIVLSLKEQGFERVMLLLGHGGLFAVGPAVREINANNDDLAVIFYELYSKPEIYNDVIQCRDDLHAGEIETSLMLYISGQLVKADEAAKNDCLPKVPRNFLNFTSILSLCKTGVWGMPSLATPEKGKKIFELEVKNCLSFTKQAFDIANKNRW